MKTLLIIAFTILFNPIFSQNMVVKSQTLDSLVWKKINEYRASKQIDPFTSFEYSTIREYSYEVTGKNSSLNMIEHSGNNFDIYNMECIYSWKKTRPDEFLNIIKNKDWDYLAEDVVNSWIASDSHERGISSSQFTKATVTSILTIDSKTGTYRFDVSYHAIY